MTADPAREAWVRLDRVVNQGYRSRGKLLEALWMMVQQLVVASQQPSSWLRRAALRSFGAHIGDKVILRPGLRVKYPWCLAIGDGSWIGEDVWIHNQVDVDIEPDVVLSQGSFITTGGHSLNDMSLRLAPVRLRTGCWVTAKCVVLKGTDLGENAVVMPGSVVSGVVPAGRILAGNPAIEVDVRRPPSAPRT